MAVLAGVLIRYAVIAGSIDEGGRSLREVASTRRPASTSSRGTCGTAPRRFVFLGWLTPLRRRSPASSLLVAAASAGSRPRSGVGAVVPVLLALGTHFPLYSALWHAFRRSATRACRSG